jgi:hypothetical protein
MNCPLAARDITWSINVSQINRGMVTKAFGIVIGHHDLRSWVVDVRLNEGEMSSVYTGAGNNVTVWLQLSSLYCMPDAGVPSALRNLLLIKLQKLKTPPGPTVAPHWSTPNQFRMLSGTRWIDGMANESIPVLPSSPSPNGCIVASNGGYEARFPELSVALDESTWKL